MSLLDGLAAVLLAYLPCVGLLIGGATASLVLNFLGRENRDDRALRLSRELIHTVTVNRAVPFVAALLPLPFVAFLWERVLVGASPLPRLAWVLPLGTLLAGCMLLAAYRSAFARTVELASGRFLAGAAGVLALIAASGLMFTMLGALFQPEKLPLIRSNPVFLLSYKSVTGFLVFLALSLGLTGGVVLLFLPRPAAGSQDPDPDYRDFVRTAGVALGVAAALPLPVLVPLGLISLPDTGLSPVVFAAAAAVLLLALAAFLVLYLLPEDRREGRGALVTVLFLLMFVAMLAGDRAAVANAFLGRAAPERREAAAPIPAEGRPAVDKPEVVKRGESVFERICMGCHRFEIRVVGPPLFAVVPKYEGDVERLKKFIRNPVKVDAGYPSMPKLGLAEQEIDAVARYLLTRVKETAPVTREPIGPEGKAVFETACRPCHLFRSRIVGPPLVEVVPKYRGDVEKLKRYIRDPVKVSPDYPLMPAVTLSDAEIDAVARYVLAPGRTDE